MIRTIAIAFTAVLAFAGASPQRPAADDHETALAAVSDIHAALAEIVRIEDGYAVGHVAYLRAAHRALNALVGRTDSSYESSVGDPGDGNGAIGNVDRLLDRSDTAVWTPAMQGAKANLLAAAQNLHESLGEKEMENYQNDLTQAMANLALVTGRPSELGVLGGLSGALGNTTLGVPAGAISVNGCRLPSRAPSYGVVSGRLAYVALPRSAASTAIPSDMSVSRIVVNGDAVVLYTGVARQAATLCHTAHLARTRRQVSPAPAPATSAAAAAPATGGLYTTEQAKAGLAVYTQSCVQCHGANLQGTAAPGVAGTEFLTTVKNNKWSLADLRTLVVENMPLSNPGSLTPQQYAQVMAYLLASNCYPAGTKPFPQTESASFAGIKIGPVDGAKPDDAKLGTCLVK